MSVTTTFDPITRLKRDILEATKTLTPQEARYLVDAYYQIQEYRKASANQVRSMTKDGEPASVLEWLFEQMETLEGQVKRALGRWAEADKTGEWAMSIMGIGPVIAAGLLAHIDIRKAPTAGHIWRFAGLDPTRKWEKGQKRPYNADLQTLCWKIGESFVKVSGNPAAVYGRLYLGRKEYEQRRNESGELAGQAQAKLEQFKIGKSTSAYGHYSSGKLPPAHVHARAKRWAVKLFLAHFQAVAYRYAFNEPPPKPFAISILGHADEIKIPNYPF